MRSVLHALRSETLKSRRTLALRLAILTPLALVALQFVVFHGRHSYGTLAGENVWLKFGQQLFMFWALLVLPLFISLETALLAGLEHKNNHWKYLYSLPVRRWYIYAAKQIVGMALIGTAILALVIFTILAGQIFRFLKPGLGFEDAVPWATLARYTFAVFVSSWIIISIQTWVALRWHSFVVATAVGIVMTISGTIFVNAGWGALYPWAIPGFIANGFSAGMPLPPLELAVGGLGGLVLACLGGWDLSRREVF